MTPRRRSSAKKSSTKRKASSGKSRPVAKTAKLANKTYFPAEKIHQLMEQKFPGGVVKPEAALFLTGVMEYLAAELLEQTINAARSRANSVDVRLTTNDVETAIQNDQELKQLMDKVRGHPSDGAG